MKIAIVGPGAMGLLYGAGLSVKHEVTMIGRNQLNMKEIREQGIRVEETDGTANVYHMNAVVDTAELTGGRTACDLVILFTKTGDSYGALDTHRNLIDPHTILMSLQNGMGHEKTLSKFVQKENIIIGTTKEGSYRKSPTSVCHSGKGSTAIGTITGEAKRFQYIADAFTECGFPCEVASDIRGMIWDKLMINASSSVLTGIFQVPQGHVATNTHIWSIARKLITELCETATADGYPFDAAEQIERIYKHVLAAPGGYTSIYADLNAGRKTEVSVINGAVLEAAKRLGIKVPTHEMVVDIVHGMEEENR